MSDKSSILQEVFEKMKNLIIIIHIIFKFQVKKFKNNHKKNL